MSQAAFFQSACRLPFSMSGIQQSAANQGEARMLISEMPEFRNRSKLLTFTADTTIKEATRVMAEKNYGSAVVVDKNGKLEGIFTERDVLRRVIAKDVDPAGSTLADVMTRDVKTARVDDEVLACLRQMSNGRFRHLPVVDEHGALQGMVSQGDFVAYTWPELMQRATANTKALLFGSSSQVVILLAAILIYTVLVQVLFP
jgi:CBS domain-containing protein